jgi:hypothetical protein
MIYKYFWILQPFTSCVIGFDCEVNSQHPTLTKVHKSANIMRIFSFNCSFIFKIHSSERTINVPTIHTCRLFLWKKLLIFKGEKILQALGMGICIKSLILYLNKYIIHTVYVSRGGGGLSPSNPKCIIKI